MEGYSYTAEHCLSIKGVIIQLSGTHTHTQIDTVYTIQLTFLSLFHFPSYTHCGIPNRCVSFSRSDSTFLLSNCSQNASVSALPGKESFKLDPYCVTMVKGNKFGEFTLRKCTAQAVILHPPLGTHHGPIYQSPGKCLVEMKHHISQTHARTHCSSQSPILQSFCPLLPSVSELLGCMFSDTMGSFEWTDTGWKKFSKELSVSVKDNKNEKKGERKNDHCLVSKNVQTGPV